MDGEEQRNEMMALSSIYNGQDIFTCYPSLDEGDEDDTKPTQKQSFTGTIRIPVHRQDALRLVVPKDLVLPTHDVSLDRENVLVHHLLPITLHFTLPPDYPSTTLPQYTLHCQWLTLRQLSEICRRLDSIAKDNVGCVVLFSWIQFLQDEVFDELGISGELNLCSAISLGRQSEMRKMKTSGEEQSVSPVDGVGIRQEPVSELAGSQGGGFWDEALEYVNMNTKTSNSEVSHKEVMKNKKRRAITVANSSKSAIARFLAARNLPENTCGRNGDKDKIVGTSVEVKSERRNGVEKYNMNMKKRIVKEPYLYDKRARNSEEEWQNLVANILEYNTEVEEKMFADSFCVCDVCGEESRGKDSVRFMPCLHVYCKECVRAYYEVLIEEGSVKNLFCPNSECDSVPLPQLIKSIVTEKMYERYERLLLSSVLDTMSDIIYCPRCEAALILDPDSNVCLCNECTMAFCKHCRLTYHGVEPCKLGNGGVMTKLLDEYAKSDGKTRALMDRRYGKRNIERALEDKYSEEVVVKVSKKCPACSTNIERSYGCNKMSCTKCHSPFCWICMSVLNRNDPYAHYRDKTSPCHQLLFQDADMDEFEMEEEILEFDDELEEEVVEDVDDDLAAQLAMAAEIGLYDDDDDDGNIIFEEYVIMK